MRTNLKDAFTPAQIKATGAHIVARNTFERIGARGERIIRLHATDIVTIAADGRVTLDSGSWRTMTTKDRINAFSPFKVYSVKGEWRVYASGHTWAEPGQSVPFYDGIVLPDAFTGEAARGKAEAAAEADKALAKAIKAFVKLIPLDGPLPEPGPGDCWFCAMTTTPGPDRTHYSAAKGQPASLGDATGNHDHLREHIAEGYMHGSLIVNALRESGPANLGFAFHHWDRPRIRRIVAKYLRRRLGLSV